MIFSTALYIFLLAAGAVAVPITSQSLIALRPNITSPKADVAWRMGSTHNVTWGKNRAVCSITYSDAFARHF